MTATTWRSCPAPTVCIWDRRICRRARRGGCCPDRSSSGSRPARGTRRGEKDGADYLGVGPIFATGTKPDAGPALGLEALGAIVRSVSIPVVAIGGIDRDNIAAVIAAGAAGA